MENGKLEIESLDLINDSTNKQSIARRSGTLHIVLLHIDN